MNILLCEGKNDAWFFDELMNLRFASRNRMCTMYDDSNNNKLKKLQEMCGHKCYDHTKDTCPLIIYGDGGKSELLKVLRRLVIEILGKNNYIIMIRDEDDAPSDELNRIFLEELEAISRDKSKFTTYLPNLERINNQFILNHPKSRGILKVEQSIVPSSLEKQIVKKTVELKCPRKSEILERESHDALELLADEYYDGDRQKLIRESSAWLRDEAWVTKIDCLVN